MAAAANSARPKQQWRPSRGSGQIRDATDRSGNGNSGFHSALQDIGPSLSSSTALMASSSFSSSSGDTSSSKHKILNNENSFLPYLPHDDAVAAGLGADLGGIDAVETQRVADLLNEDFGRLLRMQPSEFWKAVTMDSSIEVSLDSYLQFRRRWYDSHSNEGGKPLAGVIVGDQLLFRRVFMVLYHMSLNLESRAQPTDVNLLSEGQTEVIFQRRFFDIPKLLDICAIYGHDNQDLTRQLVKNAFSTNAGLFEDLANIVPVISNTVQTMQQRCLSTLTMQLPTKSHEMSLVVKIRQELLEVLDYLIDAVISLHTFVGAYWEGSLVLVLAGNLSDSGYHILVTLSTMHDCLIPVVRKSFSHLQGLCTDKHMGSAVETRSTRLRFCLIDLVWRLFYFSHLKESSFADSQDSYINHLLEVYVCNPKARGEGLVQALSGMEEESSKTCAEKTAFNGVLIRNVDRKYKLLERVNQLRKKGLISLDSVQYDYVEAIVSQVATVSSVSLPNHSDLVPSAQELSEVDVLNESKISHIKDILPDYGAGFIEACLEAYDNNPEEVIQRILEGTLHPTLQSVDTTLEVKPGSRNTSLLAKDKGKGKIEEASLQKRMNFLDTQPGIRLQGDADGLTQRRSSSVLASSSSVSEESKNIFSGVSDSHSAKDLKGRFVRKDKGEEGTQALLNERLADDVLRTAAYAAQYEDEYDDSFDDLGTSIAEGVEEAESLVDLAKVKPSVGIEMGFRKDSKISSGGRTAGIGRGGWPLNNGSSQQAKSDTARENNSTIVDSQRKAQPPANRGRGRGRRNEPRGQFYVKDGMNYSYKVAGSVAVASVEDAEELKKAEKDTVYGLGQGGNVPVSGDQPAERKYSAQGSSHSRPDSSGRGGQSRGRGAPRKEHDHHHRKDRAMQKHFAGLGGF
ncbi:hypothetical protein GOP47_0003943 [Adiantum capillus-veneris]|uniref:CUE domain-containing protein n=1 Tax=Adiantum capillus-veneris TaxID=13818 RepID=A0A9D4V6K5_ADICA|nr:hypothetical protein GOP47_0003943 [Adiantum capillus-veneris]